MDVEGSEYDLINHMCEDNCFSYINEFRVEFHGPAEHQECKKKIRNQNKEIIIDNHWDAMHPPYLKNKFSEEYYKTYTKAINEP